MSPHPAISHMLAAMPWVTIQRAPLPNREDARYYPAYRTILIRHGLRGARYYSTLAHELIHAERGDTSCANEVLEAREELEVEREASRRLIPVDRLADALLWCRTDHELACELEVDADMLVARKSCLTKDEVALINDRLELVERSITWNG